MRYFFSFLFIFSISNPLTAKKKVELTDINLNATLWMQQAAEYRANTLQTYQLATLQLSNALQDKTYTAAVEQQNNFSNLPPALIMDLDETVFDNSFYQAELIKNHQHWTPRSWDQWVAKRAAGSVPGAIEFIKAANKQNIKVIFISNRACSKRDDTKELCPQKKDSINNLQKLGLNNLNADDILLKNDPLNKTPLKWGSEKQSRRLAVAEHYRIVMLFGDDLGDFLAGVKKNTSPQQRAVEVDKFRQQWGTHWFMLPNPTYGSWLNILQKPKSKYLKTYQSLGIK